MSATKNETSKTATTSTKKETARQYAARVKGELAKLEGLILTADASLQKVKAQETVLALRIGAYLNQAEAYFVDENGAYVGTELVAWAMDKFHYSQNTVYDYKQAARFLSAHPTARPIVKAVDTAILLDRFAKRAPDKLADVLGKAPKNASKPELIALIEEIAPKPKPTPTENKESLAKQTEALKDKLRTRVVKRFAKYATMHPADAAQTAMQDGAKYGAEFGPLTLVAIREIAKEFNTADNAADES